MILNETMVNNLEALCCIESEHATNVIDIPTVDLGNSLIGLYYTTTNLKTRELITQFMTEAGVVWLRKLLTKDMDPIASTLTRFASLNDYIGLLAANDENHFQDLSA